MGTIIITIRMALLPLYMIRMKQASLKMKMNMKQRERERDGERGGWEKCTLPQYKTSRT
jgi:hypothetical protein